MTNYYYYKLISIKLESHSNDNMCPSNMMKRVKVESISTNNYNQRDEYFNKQHQQRSSERKEDNLPVYKSLFKTQGKMEMNQSNSWNCRVM